MFLTYLYILKQKKKQKLINRTQLIKFVLFLVSSVSIIRDKPHL